MKERLIGAAVLVVLGVWLIPWVLDGPERAEDAEVTLELPTAEEAAPVRTETIRLDREPDTSPVPPPDVDTPSPQIAEPVLTPIEAGPAGTEPAADAVEPSPEPAEAADPPVPDGAWMVQLGSFGEAENAERLAERAAGYGFDARVTPYRAGGRTMHRVRIGPHESRPLAEAAASSLTAHGFVAQVVQAD